MIWYLIKLNFISIKSSTQIKQAYKIQFFGNFIINFKKKLSDELWAGEIMSGDFLLSVFVIQAKNLKFFNLKA